MKIGLSTLLFGGLDRDIAIHEASNAGYDGLELCSIPGMVEHFHPNMCDCIYEGIKMTLEKSGLLLESVGCSGAGPGTERFEGLMEAAADLGAKYFTVSTGGEADDEDAWATMMATMRSAIPVCERTGVKLSVMPHVRASVYSIASARRFMEEIDSEWLGLNLDNTHLERVGDCPVDAVKELREWIFTGRIRDFRSNDLGIGLTENQVPGKGQANVKGYWEALREYTDLEIVMVEIVGRRGLARSAIADIITETISVLKSYG